MSETTTTTSNFVDYDQLAAGATVPPLPRWAESGEDDWSSANDDGTLFANRECNIGEVGHREPGARDGKVHVLLAQEVRCKDGIVTEGPLEVILSGFDSIMVPARSVRALVALLLEAANVIEEASK